MSYKSCIILIVSIIVYILCQPISGFTLDDSIFSPRITLEMIEEESGKLSKGVKSKTAPWSIFLISSRLNKKLETQADKISSAAQRLARRDIPYSAVYGFDMKFLVPHEFDIANLQIGVTLSTLTASSGAASVNDEAEEIISDDSIPKWDCHVRKRLAFDVAQIRCHTVTTAPVLRAVMELHIEDNSGTYQANHWYKRVHPVLNDDFETLEVEMNVDGCLFKGSVHDENNMEPSNMSATAVHIAENGIEYPLTEVPVNSNDGTYRIYLTPDQVEGSEGKIVIKLNSPDHLPLTADPNLNRSESLIENYPICGNAYTVVDQEHEVLSHQGLNYLSNVIEMCLWTVNGSGILERIQGAHYSDACINEIYLEDDSDIVYESSAFIAMSSRIHTSLYALFKVVFEMVQSTDFAYQNWRNLPVILHQANIQKYGDERDNSLSGIYSERHHQMHVRTGSSIPNQKFIHAHEFAHHLDNSNNSYSPLHDIWNLRDLIFRDMGPADVGADYHNAGRLWGHLTSYAGSHHGEDFAESFAFYFVRSHIYNIYWQSQFTQDDAAAFPHDVAELSSDPERAFNTVRDWILNYTGDSNLSDNNALLFTKYLFFMQHLFDGQQYQ